MNPFVKEFFLCVERYPNAVAVVEDEHVTTYKQLSQIVNTMAGAFIPILNKSESKAVVIALNKGVEAYAAIFATLMSGGFYIPLDLSLPVERQLKILNSVSPAILISKSDFKNLSSKNTLFVDSTSLIMTGIVEAEPSNRLAYVKFTSGSTGEPKGVMVSQKAVLNYVDWVKKSFRPTTNDRWSQHPNISFDISVTDIFGALTTGGSLYCVANHLDLVLPGTWIKNNKITIWNSVPSVLDSMAKMGEIT
ncbi:AMP-binding protein, partial [Paracoccaceae bacterium]|nr:AMP-binding protein [Paracoccaceae bacterium]